jgi:hypothetical protein
MSDDFAETAKSTSAAQERARRSLAELSPLITKEAWVKDAAQNSCPLSPISSSPVSATPQTVARELKKIVQSLEQDQRPIRGYEMETIYEGLSSSSKKENLYAAVAIVTGCSGCRRINQDCFAAEPRFMEKLTALLLHKRAQIAGKAAQAIDALCAGIHQRNQDTLTTDTISHLGELLLCRDTACNASYALGRACEAAHKENQKAIANNRRIVSTLTTLVRNRDPEISCAAVFATQQARAGLGCHDNAKWENAGSLVRSASAPRMVEDASPYSSSGFHSPASPMSAIISAWDSSKVGRLLEQPQSPQSPLSPVSPTRRMSTFNVNGSAFVCNPVFGKRQSIVLTKEHAEVPTLGRNLLQSRLTLDRDILQSRPSLAQPDFLRSATMPRLSMVGLC